MEGALIVLALLACPVGMGLMMWFMSKGMKGRGDKEKQESPDELESLRAEQQRLAAEVSRLEHERTRDGEVAAR